MAYLYKVTSIDDFEDYYRLKADETAVFWSGFETSPKKDLLLTHFQKILLNDSISIYYLKDKSSNLLIGYVQVLLKENNTIEVSHSILSNYQNKGYGTMIYNLLIIEAMKCNYEKIIAWVSEKNTPSIKNFIKNGFIKTEQPYKEVLLKACNRIDKFYMYERKLNEE